MFFHLPFSALVFLCHAEVFIRFILSSSPFSHSHSHTSISISVLSYAFSSSPIFLSIFPFSNETFIFFFICIFLYSSISSRLPFYVNFYSFLALSSLIFLLALISSVQLFISFFFIQLYTSLFLIFSSLHALSHRKLHSSLTPPSSFTYFLPHSCFPCKFPFPPTEEDTNICLRHRKTMFPTLCLILKATHAITSQTSRRKRGRTQDKAPWWTEQEWIDLAPPLQFLRKHTHYGLPPCPLALPNTCIEGRLCVCVCVCVRVRVCVCVVLCFLDWRVCALLFGVGR